MARYVFDIETNSLDINTVSTVWCISITCLDDSLLQNNYYGDDIPKAISILEHEADEIIGHNIILYDIPILEKLYNFHYTGKVTDTFVISETLNPDRVGGHKLESWGKQFGIEKKPDLDWTVWDEGLIDRCETDVKINVKLYEHFQKELAKWDWDKALRLEHAMFQIQEQQERNGVKFDYEKADILLDKLDTEVAELDKKLLAQLPMRTVAGSEVSRPFLKAGGYTKRVARFFYYPAPLLYTPKGKAIVHNIQGPFSFVTFEKFNLNSSDQIKTYLLSQGWVPTTYNYKTDKRGKKIYEKGKPVRTSPILTEDSFGTIKGNLGKLVARRNILGHRRRSIKNLEDNTKGYYNLVRADGRIEAKGIPQAAVTGRYRHKVIVNVPKNKPYVVYGKECRELFTVEDGMTMVGCDAKGLEARCEAHLCYPYEGGEEYAKELVDGNIHERNAELFGVNYDLAKRAKFALSYGCQVAMLESILLCGKPLAKVRWHNFWDNNTALKGLRADLERALKYNKGYIKGLDGRKIWIRSKHSLVNFAIQALGILIVKTAMCYVWKVDVPNMVWTVVPKLMIQNHDEWQAEVHPHDVLKYSKSCMSAFKRTEKFYNFRVPLYGDIAVGKNWAECH